MEHRTELGTEAERKRALEVADILAEYIENYKRHTPLTEEQAKVVRAIIDCRTARLGGQRHWCDCGFERFVYHSCRNRHCPKCQSLTRAQWLEDRRQEVLPVPYFHCVFTLPHELNALVGWAPRNQRALLTLLFDSTAQTLLLFGRNELGGRMGFISVLHTWDQQLRAHYHVHCLVAGGALADDEKSWCSSRPDYLFPVRAMSQVFRGKYLQKLGRVLECDELKLPPQLEVLKESDSRQAWIRELREKSWNVYTKRPFAGTERLLEYLGRYTHRVALSNERLLSADREHVSFSYRDRRDGDKKKVATTTPDEFIRRFLLHVLPPNFAKVRNYGFLSNRLKKRSLAACREILGAPPPPPVETKTTQERLTELTGTDPCRCPRCGNLLQVEDLPAVAGAQVKEVNLDSLGGETLDTS